MRHAIVEEDLARIAAAALPWPQFRGSTVLISGANGFLPAYMVETLLYLNETARLDVSVVGLVRNRERAERRFAQYAGRKDLRFVVQDVCIPAAVEGPLDYVIHAASQATPKYYGRDPVGTFDANVLGTHHLLALAQAKRSRGFLFFSSSEIYGRVAPENVPTAEDACGQVDPMQVRSCYAEGKRAGETLCVAWQQQHGVPIRVVRPFHTYGPGMRMDDGRVFADFVADIVQGRDIVMKSDGLARRAFCYLADATLGFFTVLLSGQDGQAYNVGNEQAECSIVELAELLAGLFPEKALRVVRQNPRPDTGYLRSTVDRSAPNTARLRALGWAPATPLPEGFRRTIGSFR